MKFTAITLLAVLSLSFNAFACEEGKMTYIELLQTDARYGKGTVNPALMMSKACFVPYQSNEVRANGEAFRKAVNEGTKRLAQQPEAERTEQIARFIEELANKFPLYLSYEDIKRSSDDIVVGSHTDPDPLHIKKFDTVSYTYTEFNLSAQISLYAGRPVKS